MDGLFKISVVRS